jgi:3-hydroxyacyl-[acyl-carrier-protein] dehydratase
MRLKLIDRIVALEPGVRITAVKVLSMAEEYLQDHFPRFPVMPGVLMLEAMYQASAWLIHRTEGFAHAAVVLKEAKNVKFGGFVEPGQLLTVTAQMVTQDEHTATLKVQGVVDDAVAVSARLILERFNLSDRYPERAATDAYLKRCLRKEFELLCTPAASLETV